MFLGGLEAPDIGDAERFFAEHVADTALHDVATRDVTPDQHTPFATTRVRADNGMLKEPSVAHDVGAGKRPGKLEGRGQRLVLPQQLQLAGQALLVGARQWTRPHGERSVDLLFDLSERLGAERLTHTPAEKVWDEDVERRQGQGEVGRRRRHKDCRSQLELGQHVSGRKHAFPGLDFFKRVEEAGLLHERMRRDEVGTKDGLRFTEGGRVIGQRCLSQD